MFGAVKPLLFGRAADTSDPSGGLHVWYTHPLGMVDALSAPHMSNDMVRWLTGPATDGLRALQRATATPLIFIHDWREARTYDLKARANLVAWGLGMGAKAVHSITIVLRPDSPSMVKMACHAGVVPFAVAGIKMTVEDDFNAAVARLGVRAR